MQTNPIQAPSRISGGVGGFGAIEDEQVSLQDRNSVVKYHFLDLIRDKAPFVRLSAMKKKTSSLEKTVEHEFSEMGFRKISFIFPEKTNPRSLVGGEHLRDFV